MKREKLWVVRPGDGATVSAIVARAGEDPKAIAEGRVFVGKKRVTADRPVKPGDAVRIGPPCAPAEDVVLFANDGFVACVKPAGLPTVPDRRGASHSLVALASAATGARDLRVTSRLDREVSGVVVFATDARAEEQLRDARARGLYHRRYVALAAGPVPEAGSWDAPIGRADDPLLRRAHGGEAKEARTDFACVAVAHGVALLAVDPQTGRTHQIRVHASHAGAPLVGDRDYGGPGRITREDGRVIGLARVALHAARVDVPGVVTAAAPVPAELRDAWRSLGGDDAAWSRAAGLARTAVE